MTRILLRLGSLVILLLSILLLNYLFFFSKKITMVIYVVRNLSYFLLRYHSYCNLSKRPTFREVTNGFPTKWRLRNDCRNSLLMTCHYPDLGSASDCLKICFNQPEALTTSNLWMIRTSLQSLYSHRRTLKLMQVRLSSGIARPQDNQHLWSRGKWMVQSCCLDTLSTLAFWPIIVCS